MQFDTLIKDGRVVDPAPDIDGRCDVAISAGKIERVAPDIPLACARTVIDASGKLALPGLVDTHAHVYQYVVGRFGLDADLVGVHSAVTTLVDQGGSSCMTLPGFREFVVEIEEGEGCGVSFGLSRREIGRALLSRTL